MVLWGYLTGQGNDKDRRKLPDWERNRNQSSGKELRYKQRQEDDHIQGFPLAKLRIAFMICKLPLLYLLKHNNGDREYFVMMMIIKIMTITIQTCRELAFIKLWLHSSITRDDPPAPAPHG